MVNLTPISATFAAERCKPVVYVVVAFRVPMKGEFYLAKTDEILKCTAKNCSRRAKPRLILTRDKTHEYTRLNA